ncbi:SDR family NAD(P)-dependent oxidoreductase [Blastopirellula retiformator]|uniref:3-oxoacyl-[acyl-carrier-protein] reductase FabG n=1 Tax=Blastopirellula retiformator TaxID=2527970 RepID=A0A5C5UYV8_9BACT|nr:SDR family oxidoreductase [Blastopirellula retiformator]TWT30655.1 3-oxoacyl-[acyl-carrier-protein] reductase FabG [Blastopirellula retiformator]
MPFTAILGATGTIGSCLAQRLASAGDQVLLVGRSAEKLEQLGATLQQPWLVTDQQQAITLEDDLRKAAEQHGPLDALVCCVGSVLLKAAHLTSDEEFQEVIATNLVTAFATVRAGARLLRQRGGSMVLFASAAAEIGIPNHEAIAAAKGGVIGLARSAAATYAPQNIRVNVISPGLIRTELTRRIWDSPAAASASQKMHALGRFGEPEQVASLAAWLLQSENDWMTGQVLGLDGGLGHLLPRG